MYEVIGGDINDNDKNTYLYYYDSDGHLVSTGKSIGVTATMYSFFNSDISLPDGWARGSIIDPNDNSGVDFISMFGPDISLFEYAYNARSNHKWDFKTQNGRTTYQGMPIGLDKSGNIVFASARDIGNIVAGYMLGLKGADWTITRIVFDIYQEICSKSINDYKGLTSQTAQAYGWYRGYLSRIEYVLNFYKSK